MTDKERRDKRFRKLCKWMSEAGEIAEILSEDCAAVKQVLTADDEDDTKGIRSALAMLEFLTVLADNPANYRGMAFPELEFGMKFLRVASFLMEVCNDKCGENSADA